MDMVVFDYILLVFLFLAVCWCIFSLYVELNSYNNDWMKIGWIVAAILDTIAFSFTLHAINSNPILASKLHLAIACSLFPASIIFLILSCVMYKRYRNAQFFQIESEKQDSPEN